MKKTKQGVRDLNSIKGKPRGKFLQEVPETQSECGCNHKNKVIDHYFEITTCLDCGKTI